MTVVGIILVIAGFIVSGIGTYAGAKCPVTFPICQSGPYSYTIGILGVVIVVVGGYFVSYN